MFDVQAYQRKYRAEHKEKISAIARRNRLKTLYNLTPEEFWQRMAEQEHRCAICGDMLVPPGKGHQQNGKGWNVDHDHKTKTARGILCAPCNRGLGQFKDRRELLERAAAYLDKWSKSE